MEKHARRARSGFHHKRRRFSPFCALRYVLVQRGKRFCRWVLGWVDRGCFSSLHVLLSPLSDEPFTEIRNSCLDRARSGSRTFAILQPGRFDCRLQSQRVYRIGFDSNCDLGMLAPSTCHLALEGLRPEPC